MHRDFGRKLLDWVIKTGLWREREGLVVCLCCHCSQTNANLSWHLLLNRCQSGVSHWVTSSGLAACCNWAVFLPQRAVVCCLKQILLTPSVHKSHTRKTITSGIHTLIWSNEINFTLKTFCSHLCTNRWQRKKYFNKALGHQKSARVPWQRFDKSLELYIFPNNIPSVAALMKVIESAI